MLVPRSAKVVRVFVAVSVLAAGYTWASPPTAEEMAQCDRWVREHFPAQPAGAPSASTPAQSPEAGLMVWTNYGPVLCNRLPDRPLQIAEQKFEHGLYFHAPSRVQVTLPRPGKTMTAVIGILTNPSSQGGSIVFSVAAGEKRLFTSAVLHRGEPGVPMSVDLGGAGELTLSVWCTEDGISSDQAVWGDAMVVLDDGQSVRLGDLPLRDPLSRNRPVSPLPFSFFYGNRPSDEFLSTWNFQEQRDSSRPDRTTRVRTYTDPQTGLIVRCSVVEYANYPTVEWTLSFKNSGDHDTPILAGILPLDTRLERGAEGEFLLHHFIGSPCQANDYEPLETILGPKAETHITTQGGRPTNSDLPYFNIETGSNGGVIAVVSWAGQWAAHFARDDGRGLRITGGQEATSFRLRPGEEVRSPLVVLQFYQGDWVRAQNVWRSWMLEHNVPRRDGKILQPFIFVCTGNYYPGLMTDAATELQFLRGFLEQGIQFDYWNQDAGWYPCDPIGWPKVGTWEVDRKRWPKGLREATDFLHSHGAKAITWFQPERVAGGTWLAENHPEWIMGGAGGGILKIGEPECRKWITDRVDKVLTEEGIDFYRQDFNIDPLYYWRGNDAEDRQGITEIRHVEGYFAYWDELVRRHPALWIDSCASGGRRNDLETLRRAVPILRSDYVGDPYQPDFDPLTQQNHIHGISFWMPYHGSGFSAIDPYVVRSLMGPIVGIGTDTRIKDLDYALLRKLCQQYRQISACYLGDYYPLTPYRKTADVWAARQFDRPDAGEGIVQAFRRKDCMEESQVFKLRGLDPQAVYTLADLDSGKSNEFTGRELTDEGLRVTLSDRPGAAIFTYRRMK